jgi:cell fate regulator YaaT (PSP1 superfamily)
MEKITQVKLREVGQSLYFKCSEEKIMPGDYVIVEADRGTDYGHVVLVVENKPEGNALASDSQSHKPAEKSQEEPLRKVLRLATGNDLKQIDDNKLKAKEDFRRAQAKIEEYKLDMKLVDCEYSFDRGKVIFYFTAEGRVDFRGLVKELAKIFKARIELRQIGVRDEARLVGGFGICGRKLCCATFLKDFEPVMIKMAKEQGLALNPPKISGICGRLMCCLAYEYAMYNELSQGLPKEGDSVSVPEGKGKVVSVNKLKRCCCIEFDDGRQVKKEYK